MSSAYRAVNWMPTKRSYDLVIAGAVAAYLFVFVAVGKAFNPGEHAISDPILLLRALGTCAYLMLHVILCIGPLARLDKRFLPLVFNRRHLGVATFAVAALHALIVLGWYHGFGIVTPFESLLNSNTAYGSIAAFPFEILGVAGFLILFLMAATSHDFWLHNLSPVVWKRLHMLVYVAWGLLVMHVALGALQSERSVVYPIIVTLGVIVVASLHLAVGRREVKHDQAGEKLQVANLPQPLPGREGNQDTATPATSDTWIDVGCVDDIREGRAITVCLPGAGRDRVAVYRYGGRISVVTNQCVHQAGPLGEGKIIDGCITCPWHGYTYQPHNGQSPPPFTEKIATYRVKVRGRRILVDPAPLPAGTHVAPANESSSTGE